MTKHELDIVASSNSDGPDYGLSLVIDIEKSQYMRRGLSSKEGLIIALASPSEFPNILANPLEIGMCTNNFFRVITHGPYICSLVIQIQKSKFFFQLSGIHHRLRK